jgi:hypothetical protein
MATTPSTAAGDEGEIREMLLYIVKALVDYPDDVEIVLLSNPGESIFRISVHPGDVAELIGNGGRMERALCCIVLASGRKLGRRLTIDIVQGASRLQ